MSDSTIRTGALIIPTLRYRDAIAAIGWLSGAFGFEKHLVVPDGEGGIAHAQLALGGAMIMLASSRDDIYGRLVGPPGEIGAVTQALYIIVDDADALHDRATRAGAEIVMEIEDWDHGGRGFTCRDPEGHVWSFGTYDPWADSEG